MAYVVIFEVKNANIANDLIKKRTVVPFNFL